ncbi:hypothetical protein BDW74DRAFT_166544 [Aspergillus multicolor]|uniref:putative AT DNA binding protein n=1 Tax=Aspergillus multicolor TaxID=41759 RepID=UPI003CCE4BAA
MFSTHSASSSPDILAPPGDADYLISSPFRPFPGRQSSLMSPANRRILQTPGAAKRKRISLSPAKSAHSIRFDDILLPGSPTRNPTGRQRPSSPDKAQADGNDEQENQGSPSRKRPKPTTTTTKVPLKDDSEQTPRRKRGRPRNAGPGNTPGPFNSEQKRRRELEGRSWSPLNLAGDADSDDGFDDDQLLDIPFDTPAQTELPQVAPDHVRDSRPALERTYDTPNGDAIDRFHSQQGDDNIHSTPSKMPSPTRDLQNLSRENSIHAGHTPMPPRRYPTPNSSSQIDDERRGRSRPGTNVATSPHRDFDTIMESEGFSMHAISSNSKLAKGPLKPFIERETNGVIRRNTRVLDRRSEEIPPHSPSPDPRPSPAQNFDSQQQTSGHSTTERRPFSPIVSKKPSPKFSLPAVKPRPSLRLATIVRAGIILARVMSQSNPPYNAESPVPDYMESRQRLDAMFRDLSPESQRVLGAALGLGQALAIRRKYMELSSPQKRALIEEELQEEGFDSPDFQYTRRNVSDIPNQQLDGAPDSSPGTEMKRRLAEWQREREKVIIVIDSDVGTPNSRGRGDAEDIDDADEDLWMPGQEGNEVQETEANYDNLKGHYDDEDPWLPSHDARLEDAEEGHGNDGINDEEGDNDGEQSPQLLVQGEEEGDEQEGEGEEDDYDVEHGINYDIARSPRIHRQEEHEEELDLKDEQSNEDEGVDGAADDDGYEDIWQVQAFEEGTSGRGSMIQPQNDVQSSPWKGGPTPADRGYSTTYSPAPWVDGQGKVPFFGHSRVSKLREQEVDFGPHAEVTPNRFRYYYGKSSPVSTAQGRSPQRVPSSAITERHVDAGKYDVEPDEPDEPEDYLDLSPEKDLEDETFQIDPTTRIQTELQSRLSDFADNASVSDISGNEPSVHDESLTPRNPPAAKDVPASSWIQRFTSLTPGWLKPPIRKSSPQHKSPLHKSPTPPTSREASKDPSPEEQSEQGSEDIDIFEQVRQEDAREVSLDDKSVSSIEQRPSPDPQLKIARASATPKKDQKAKAPDGPPRLTTSGYFSNAHYTLLRGLYRLAKVSPQSFPYHPSFTHADIIGDWIWTSDNTYGVPITEMQFAIIYRFRQELAVQDVESGGSGWVGWTDADLHRRLVSVIIGEQIREDRRESLDQRPTRSRPKSIIQGV